MSQGPGDERGPWNQGELWDFVEAPDELAAVDGGDGQPAVAMNENDVALDAQLTARQASQTEDDPITGAELGAGEGAGRVNIIPEEYEDDAAE
jgi:Mn-containing catalase